MRNLSKFISLCSYFPHLPHLDLRAGRLSRSEVSRQISTGANAPSAPWRGPSLDNGQSHAPLIHQARPRRCDCCDCSVRRTIAEEPAEYCGEGTCTASRVTRARASSRTRASRSRLLIALSCTASRVTRATVPCCSTAHGHCTAQSVHAFISRVLGEQTAGRMRTSSSPSPKEEGNYLHASKASTAHSSPRLPPSSPISSYLPPPSPPPLEPYLEQLELVQYSTV